MHTNCLTSLGLQDTKSTAAEFKQLFTIHLITKSKDNSPSLSNLTNKKPKLILKIKLILNFTEVSQQTVCPPLEWHPCGKLQQSVSSLKSACHCVTLVLKRFQISSDPNLSVTTPNSQNNTKKHVHSSIRPATPVFCRVKIIVFSKECDEFEESNTRASVTCLTLQSEKKVHYLRILSIMSAAKTGTFHRHNLDSCSCPQGLRFSHRSSVCSCWLWWTTGLKTQPFIPICHLDAKIWENRLQV